MNDLPTTRLYLLLLLLLPLALSPMRSSAQAVPEESVTAVLWFQRSAEYRALCYQAYNLARLRVLEYLENPDSVKPSAVIFDIDETLLDNSPSEARNIIDGKTFSQERWKAWSDQASADFIPGGLNFCHFLAANGIEVIYLSNRLTSETTATLQNLQKWSFPYADSSHLYLKSDISSKELRRNIIENQYAVVLLIGDNLSDFDQVFEDRSVNFGFNTIDSLSSEMGKKFIVLPNPMYGDWTKPLNGERKAWLDTRGH